MEQVQQLLKEFEAEQSKLTSFEEVESLRIKFLGKKGPLKDLMESLAKLPKEQKPQAGKAVNEAKVTIAQQIEALKERFRKQEWQASFEQEAVDVTLPGTSSFPNGSHILSNGLDHILGLLKGMGFSIHYGPHIESEYYNFDALNFPENHPAKDMHDTFYTQDGKVLRTHTSNTQIRMMESHTPPIRMVSPGRCYRNEEVDASHHIMFHQVEGLYVDKGVSFADLLATLKQFIHKLLGDGLKVRFRPSYFPFVEPGLEMDICWQVDGQEKWLEVLGAGLVHPNVLKGCNIDPEVYSGYAFGMGVERLILLQQGIDDIRLLTENDMRFLWQF